MKTTQTKRPSSKSKSVAERLNRNNDGSGVIAQKSSHTLIDDSPRQAAQRKYLVQLRTDGGGSGDLLPLQRQGEDEETLQKKSEMVQCVEDEEKPLQGKHEALQRVEEDEKPLQGKFETTQRLEEEEKPLQGKFAGGATVQREAEPEPEPNNTGLPDNLKSGVESLSGLPLDDVKVHYNSDKPAQLNALAYTQGTDIHVAPGQEKHLPHEAWHVVQQAQGRVQPTMQMKDGVPVNDDPGLEHEADVMGGHALAPPSQPAQQLKLSQEASSESLQQQTIGKKEFQAARPAVSFPGTIAQLSLAELNATNTKWTQYHNTHGTVNGIVTGDIARLQAAYNHYSLPANGGLNDAAADITNPFLKSSVKGLLHDVEEIDSHAGGYYFQQVVKDQRNTTLGVNVITRTGAHGGASNLADPDLVVQQGIGGNKDAVEVKRTTTANGCDALLNSALEQLSLRQGFNNASVAIEVTHPTQAATIIANRGAVDTMIINKVGTLDRAFGRNYWPSAQPVLGFRRFTITVCIRSAVPGAATAVIYDRDFNVIIDQTVGRRGNTYALITSLSTTRV